MRRNRSKTADPTTDDASILGIPRVDPRVRPKWKSALAWWTGGVLVATKPGAAVWRALVAPLDAPIMNATEGHMKLTAIPLVVLTSRGARSGQFRETPLTYITEGDDVILVASNFGGTKHPGWYHNLRANPQCELHVGSRGGRFTASEVTGQERDRLFRLAEIHYAGFGKYQKRTQGVRTIRVMRLTPTRTADGHSGQEERDGFS